MERRSRMWRFIVGIMLLSLILCSTGYALPEYSEEDMHLFSAKELNGILSEMSDVSLIITADKDTDNFGLLTDVDAYSVGVFYTGTLLRSAGSDVLESNLLDNGTLCGGAVEVYCTVEEAQARVDYLRRFDGTSSSVGSHTAWGNYVIRISKQVTPDQRSELEDKIAHSIAIEANLANHFGTVTLTDEEAEDYAKAIVDSWFTDAELNAFDAMPEARAKEEALKAEILDAYGSITMANVGYTLGSVEMTDDKRTEYSDMCRRLIEKTDDFFENEIFISQLQVDMLGLSDETYDTMAKVWAGMRERVANAGEQLMADVEKLLSADDADVAACLEQTLGDAMAVYDVYADWQKAADEVDAKSK